MELKLNDVYKFRYNTEWINKDRFLYHCFDGQLIVKQRRNSNDLYLEDTYWNSSDNKNFTLNEALNRGELEYICNLDEIEKIKEYEMNYYDNKDLFDLSRQHNCYKEYYKKIGAEKCPAKMEQVLIRKIESIESEIRSRNHDLERMKENLEKLKAGDINIYII